jgi:hypothetical protein
MRKREPSLWPGAIIFVVLFSMGMTHPILNGWQPRHRVVKVTSEPQSFFIECWFMPWLSWCARPEDPKQLPPERPIGWCSDTDTGPCP